MQLLQLIENYGSVIGTILFLLLLIMAGTVFILKKIVENYFQHELDSLRQAIIENSEKNITQFKKVYDNVFDVSSLSNSVLQNTIIWGDKIRIEIYQKVSNLFFEILYTKSSLPKDIDKAKRSKIFQELSDKVTNIRVEIFINAIFLGELVDPLLRAQIALWDDIPIEGIDAFQFKKDFRQKNDLPWTFFSKVV